MRFRGRERFRDCHVLLARWWSDAVEHAHETEIHVQLHVTMKENQAKLVGGEIDLDFLAASRPQRDSREAEKKGQDRQEVEESSTKNCEDTMSHEMEIVNKRVEQSRPAKLAQ